MPVDLLAELQASVDRVRTDRVRTDRVRTKQPGAPVCGATEWAVCDDGRPHVYRICDQIKGHESRWHQQWHGETLWAESSDDGPVPAGPWCEHTEPERNR